MCAGAWISLFDRFLGARRVRFVMLLQVLPHARVCVLNHSAARHRVFSIAIKMNARDAITIFDSVCAESLAGALENLLHRLGFPFASARWVIASTPC